MQNDKFSDFHRPKSNWYHFPKYLDDYFSQLTGNEFKVLAYIIRKTWGDDKIEDKISYNQFLQGTFNNRGKKIIDGIGMTKKTLITALNGLQKKGLIEVVKEKGGINKYGLKYGISYTKKGLLEEEKNENKNKS